MPDHAKTKAQLVAELDALRTQLAACHVSAPQLHSAEPSIDDRQRDLEQRRQAVKDLCGLLASAHGRIDPIQSSLITTARQLLGADAAALFRLDVPEDLLVLETASGLPTTPPTIQMPPGGGFLRLAIAARYPVAATRGSSGPPAALAPWAQWAPLAEPYAAVLVIPLGRSDAVEPAMVLYWQAGRTFAPPELHLAAAFGAYAAQVGELAQLFVQAQRSAALDERQRLARELHDSVTQAFYIVKLYAEAATRRMAAGDTGTAASYLRELRSTAQDAVQDLRLLIYELRPPILEQQGLAVAIQERLDAVEGRAGLETEFVVQGEHPLTAAVEQALYRVAQEALNNALKHAQARRITVQLEQAPQQTRLTVMDDGIGFDPAAAAAHGGLGLRGMAERVAALGGRLTVDSAPRQGTVVAVEVPA